MVNAKEFGGIPMVTKKDRRHSGYVTPQATVSPKDLVKYDLCINDFYDEWLNYRDGLRDGYRDFKKIKKIYPTGWNDVWCSELIEKRICMNKKQKRLLQRRKMRKLREQFGN